MFKRTIAFIIFPFIFAHCGDNQAGIRFNLSYNTQFTISKSTPVQLPVNILSPDVTTNSEAEFAKNGTAADKVISVKASSGVLTIKSPPDATFSFAKDAYLYIKANNLDETLVAFKENINNTDKTLTLDLPDVDLAPYIKSESFTLRLRVVTDEVLSKDITVDADVMFRVKANPLK